MRNSFNNKPCSDHEGNIFGNIKSMCKHWGIRPATFSRRITVYNMSIEEALTLPVKPNGGLICYDHKGEKFYSITSMCKHWCVDRKVYMYRVTHGWTVEEALTTPPRTSQNNKGLSQNAMCRLRQPLSHKSWKKR